MKKARSAATATANQTNNTNQINKPKQTNNTNQINKTTNNTKHNQKEGGAAITSSRELAYLSTVVNVRKLNCRVRNGSGWNLPAMAAESPKPSSRFERE